MSACGPLVASGAFDEPAEAAAFAASIQTCCPVDRVASLASPRSDDWSRRMALTTELRWPGKGCAFFDLTNGTSRSTRYCNRITILSGSDIQISPGVLLYAHMHAHDWERHLWWQQDDVLSPQKERHDSGAVQESPRCITELIHCLRKFTFGTNM